MAVPQALSGRRAAPICHMIEASIRRNAKLTSIVAIFQAK
jgi:hypothetical protein